MYAQCMICRPYNYCMNNMQIFNLCMHILAPDSKYVIFYRSSLIPASVYEFVRKISLLISVVAFVSLLEKSPYEYWQLRKMICHCIFRTENSANLVRQLIFPYYSYHIPSYIYFPLWIIDLKVAYLNLPRTSLSPNVHVQISKNYVVSILKSTVLPELPGVRMSGWKNMYKFFT